MPLPVLVVHAQQVPVQGVLVVPLVPLAELAAHHQQLLARMGEHVGVEGPHAGVLLLVGARHLVDEGALHVHHLIVGQGEHEVLREGVEEGEGDVLVVVLPEIGIQLDVVEDVVHPPHVPFQVEAQAALQAALPHRVGHTGPGGGLLGDHHHVGMGVEDVGVQGLEEVHRLQVLVPAEHIGHPLAVLPAVVQVEHGGHRVHPQAVDVVLLQPEQGGGEQEGAHLIPAVVEHPGAPVGVLPLAGVGVLVAGLPVELVQAEGVLGEVGGHPVQDHADAGLVELIHQPHEVVRGAEAAGGREIAGALIAPGGVQGVLGDGEQLHMGEAHLLHVGHQVLADVPVGEHLVVAGAPPGAQVDFINIQRAAVYGVLGPVVHPALVAPLVAGQVVQLGGVAGAGLGVEGVGVGLGQHPAGGGVDGVFIGVILLQAGNKDLPDAAVQGLHGVGILAPAVEIAHNGHLLGMGSPDTEHPALLAVPDGGVGAHELLRADRIPGRKLRQGLIILCKSHR